MPMIEGTTRPYKVVTAAYEFAVDGGAVGTITLRAAPGDLAGNAVPAGAVILGGFIDVETAIASAGAATVGLTLEAAGDILAANTALAGLTLGRKSVIPAFTGATTVKTTAARSITATIAAFALTGGKFTVTLFYR